MKLFKDGYLVDIHKQTAKIADILVENGKIRQIGGNIKCDCEIVDLKGDYVIPSFVNNYCDSKKALENTYGVDADLEDAQKLLVIKNLRAGANILNDRPMTLCDVAEKSEKELEQISELSAKKKLFMKVGQDLDELGAIDKHYGKTLSEVLEEFGFLDRKSVLVGGNCLEKDELRLLKNYETQVVIVPNEDARLGRRATNLLTLKNLGFEVAIGSGEIAEIDFFAFMREILQGQRTLFEDKNVLSEKEVFEMACNGKILGIENELTEKCDANFAVVKRCESLYENPVFDLIYTKCKKDVEMTIFRGEILQKNGEIFMQNLMQYDKIIEKIKSQTRR